MANEEASCQIRFSFTAQCRVIPKQLHLWIRLYNAADGFITEIPYYLKSNQLYNYAEFYQFGYSETQAVGSLLKASKISFAFWMPEDDGKIKISNSILQYPKKIFLRPYLDIHKYKIYII